MAPAFTYRDYFTTSPLNQTVRKFWLLDNLVNSQPVLNKYVLPNGCFTVACVKGQGAVLQTCKGEVTMTPAYYFCGQASQSISIRIEPFTQLLMLQLYPWSVSALTDQSLATTTDAVLPLGKMLSQVATLLEQHQPLVDQELLWPNALISLVETHWTDLLVNAPKPFIQQACQQLFQVQGCMGVGELAQTLNCSTRWLEKQFRYYLGLSPKRFATILQVRAVVDTVQQQPLPQSLAQIALAHGFYDQAHFIRTFQSLLPQSPSKFDPIRYLLPPTSPGY